MLSGMDWRIGDMLPHIKSWKVEQCTEYKLGAVYIIRTVSFWCLLSALLNLFKLDYGGVWSVPFPFLFPFQLHCELVSSGISSQAVQNILILGVT